MFALGNISRFEGEKGTSKILIPVWNVIIDYLVLFLAVLSIVFGGMQLVSGTFECLAVVHCPGMSRSNMSDSLFSNVKYLNACKAFYSSQKTNVIKGTDVVTDVKSSVQYTNFVNSECSKSAIPNFLSYFGFVLFLQAFVLIVLDNLWLKLPVTASVIESFVSLVMECYSSPCPNFALTYALSGLPHRADNQQLDDSNLKMASTVSNNDKDKDNLVTMNGNERDNDESLDILEVPGTISAINTLYEKVNTLKKNVLSSRIIWQLYLIQAILQALWAMVFLFIDIYYMSDLQQTMTCRLTQHIPVAHDNFICSHNLAPAFVLGLQWLYLPTLGITLAVFVFIIAWTARNWKKKFQYVFDERRLPYLKATILSNLPPVEQDLGFLLHLLHSYDKSYLVRFAHFLSEKSEKKVQAYSLRKKYPVSILERQLKENGFKLSFTDIAGMPETIFKLSNEIVSLECNECNLQNDDFKHVFLLRSLRNLSVIKCGLKSIPEGILDIKLLQKLNLDGNFLTKVNASIAKLRYLTILDLSNNNLKTIEPQSFENLDNLLTVYLSGNLKLKMDALKVVLACKRLHKLYSPQHLSEKKDELNPLDREKFDAVNVSEHCVIRYSPEYAPHIHLGDHERIYKMDSCPKGIVIIINNYSYRDCPLKLSDRIGSEKDVAMVKSVFEEIGFHTVCGIDYTATEAGELVETYAEHEEYKDCDSIVVVLMSHGNEEGFVFPNGEVLNAMHLVKLVQRSPFYKGKPKLFFAQSCRSVGDRYPFGSDQNTNDVHRELYTDSAEYSLLSKRTVSLVSSPVMTAKLLQTPMLESDFLIGYSTTDGQISMRCPDRGSWYIQSLLETLRKHAWEEDILSLLTRINEILASQSEVLKNRSYPR